MVEPLVSRTIHHRPTSTPFIGLLDLIPSPCSAQHSHVPASPIVHRDDPGSRNPLTEMSRIARPGGDGMGRDRLLGSLGAPRVTEQTKRVLRRSFNLLCKSKQRPTSLASSVSDHSIIRTPETNRFKPIMPFRHPSGEDMIARHTSRCDYPIESHRQDHASQPIS